ncbi:MAG: segregation/condensation protein A [Candidatus Micrarchaeota archaeon]
MQQLELVELVKEPSWREVLLESLSSQQMNPWEVDLVKAADAYLAKVREMQAMDLRVPANVILASALLLHYKAAALQLEEPEPEEDAFIRPMMDEAIPDLMYLPGLSRTRTVTLQELIKAVEEVMSIGRRELIPRIKAPPLQIELPKENINDLMLHVHQRAHQLKDRENILLFSQLIESFNGHGEEYAQHFAHHLLPVLHLIQEEKMFAWQDRTFGDIFIKVIN